MIHFYKNKEAIALLDNNQLPSKFTYPFQYTPHPLIQYAAEEVNSYLNTRTDWQEELSHGKMFGVLLVALEDTPTLSKSTNEKTSVQNQNLVERIPAEQRFGFLAAFSGNLAGSNLHSFFVPPVFDLLRPGDFFKVEEGNISAINQQIKEITNSQEYKSLKERVNDIRSYSEQKLRDAKEKLKEAKLLRDQERNKINNILLSTKDINHHYSSNTSSISDTNFGDNITKTDPTATHRQLTYSAEHIVKYESILRNLVKESQFQKAEYKRLEKTLKDQIAQKEEELNRKENEIYALKQERKTRSAALQMKLFEHFQMLNAKGEKKDLCQIFHEVRHSIPPAGAGECALPKLLQYAYLHHLKPLAFGEFWWGESPKDEIRRHGQFYPSCKGKCEPILQHMLVGLEVDSNPLSIQIPESNPLKIIYEDEWIIAIDKPAGMLSTPGKEITDSVYERLRKMYPFASGPLLVHRLDMATSGILLGAKTKEIHAQLQSLFEARAVRKIYTAILDGIPVQKKGCINLPLCLNPMNRPRQMVSYEYGKEAITYYNVLEIEGNNSLVQFNLETGRTHQIRMHAAHQLGLNCPIKGDDLYGKHADRLYLHATEVEFVHPMTHKKLVIKSAVPFTTSHR